MAITLACKRPTRRHGRAENVRLRSPGSGAWRAATLARLWRMEGGYARPALAHGGRLRSPGSGAWRAATLARLWRMEGGYARPALAHGGRLRSPGSGAWRAATLARLCRMCARNARPSALRTYPSGRPLLPTVGALRGDANSGGSGRATCAAWPIREPTVSSVRRCAGVDGHRPAWPSAHPGAPAELSRASQP